MLAFGSWDWCAHPRLAKKKQPTNPQNIKQSHLQKPTNPPTIKTQNHQKRTLPKPKKPTPNLFFDYSDQRYDRIWHMQDCISCPLLSTTLRHVSCMKVGSKASQENSTVLARIWNAYKIICTEGIQAVFTVPQQNTFHRMTEFSGYVWKAENLEGLS